MDDKKQKRPIDAVDSMGRITIGAGIVPPDPLNRRNHCDFCSTVSKRRLSNCPIPLEVDR
jgi:hypothetical protein